MELLKPPLSEQIEVWRPTMTPRSTDRPVTSADTILVETAEASNPFAAAHQLFSLWDASEWGDVPPGARTGPYQYEKSWQILLPGSPLLPSFPSADAMIEMRRIGYGSLTHLLQRSRNRPSRRAWPKNENPARIAEPEGLVVYLPSVGVRWKHLSQVRDPTVQSQQDKNIAMSKDRTGGTVRNLKGNLMDAT